MPMEVRSEFDLFEAFSGIRNFGFLREFRASGTGQRPAERIFGQILDHTYNCSYRATNRQFCFESGIYPEASSRQMYEVVAERLAECFLGQ